MQRRIFLKFYTVCVIIVFITVTLLGFVTSTVIGVRTFNSQSQIMERAANKVASTVARMPKNYYILAGNIFDNSIMAIKETIRSDIIVTDGDGALEITTFSPAGSDMTKMPSTTVISSVLGGEVYRKARSFGSRDTTVGYTVGVPVIAQDNRISGTVFVTTSQININSVIVSTLLICFVCGMAVLLLAFVILLFVTKKMTRPIYEMSDVANSYAHGDFTKRLDVSHAHEYAPLAVAFNSMADGIDNLEQMRRAFVTDVSHELRTPMTTITGFIDGMLDGTIPPELHEKYLYIVKDEVGRISRMVNSFLDLARIQSGQMTYVKKPFDIVSTAGKALFTFEDRIEQNGIDIVTDFENDSVIVYGDEDAIYRVVYNLLDNAIKFTALGGEIRLGIKSEGTKAKIYVWNSGCGISKDDAAHIFERFYKADKSRSINAKGTGIGLYLVKSIISEHGEDIILNSKEGEFAQFTFTLPLYNE